MTTTLPTVDELNKLSASSSRTMLLMLRCLMSSDGLTHHFELFKSATIRDIVHNATEAFRGEFEDLTHDEIAEITATKQYLFEYARRKGE